MRLTVLTVPRHDAELAGERLWSAGASAIEERDDGDGLTALVTVLAGDDRVSTARLGRLPAHWDLTFVDDDGDVSQTWRDHAQAVPINAELELRPAWLHPTSGTGRTVIAIEPAGAFGLGDHPTTRLSADAVWRLTRVGSRVLDVGAGSGVLAIVAIRRGASSAVAIDVAEAAREATVDNARRNGVAGRIETSCAPIAEIDGTFDLVVANILAPTLVAMAGEFARVTRPGGRLVVSGVLAGAHRHVLDALRDFEVVAVDELDGWACVELIRSS